MIPTRTDRARLGGILPATSAAHRTFGRIIGRCMTRLAAIAFCVCLGLPGCGGDATTSPVIHLPVPDDVRGLWQSNDAPGMCVSIVADSATGCYTAVLMRDPHCPCCPGQREWELCWNAERRAFVGRHLWGGCGYDTTYWGADGSLEITQYGPDALVATYLDHVYTGGWRFVRATECADRRRFGPSAGSPNGQAYVPELAARPRPLNASVGGLDGGVVK
jgi:hypothetical protein